MERYQTSEFFRFPAINGGHTYIDGPVDFKPVLFVLLVQTRRDLTNVRQHGTATAGLAVGQHDLYFGGGVVVIGVPLVGRTTTATTTATNNKHTRGAKRKKKNAKNVLCKNMCKTISSTFAKIAKQSVVSTATTTTTTTTTTALLPLKRRLVRGRAWQRTVQQRMGFPRGDGTGRGEGHRGDASNVVQIDVDFLMDHGSKTLDLVKEVLDQHRSVVGVDDGVAVVAARARAHGAHLESG